MGRVIGGAEMLMNFKRFSSPKNPANPMISSLSAVSRFRLKFADFSPRKPRSHRQRPYWRKPKKGKIGQTCQKYEISHETGAPLISRLLIYFLFLMVLVFMVLVLVLVLKK